MLKDFLHLQEPIKYILYREKNLQHLSLSDNEWLFLERLMKLFGIFEKPTTILQGKYFINILLLNLY